MPPHVSLSSKSISGTKSDSMLSYSGYFLCYIVFIIGAFARNFHIVGTLPKSFKQTFMHN